MPDVPLFGGSGRHEPAPRWADHIAQMCADNNTMLHSILERLATLVASAQEVTDAVHSLFGVLDNMTAKIQQLVSAGGGDSGQLQALLDEVNTHRQSAADALAAVNVPAPPPAPAGP